MSRLGGGLYLFNMTGEGKLHRKKAILLIILAADKNFFKMGEGNIAENEEARTVGVGNPPSTYEPKSAREILNIFLSV